MQITESSKDNFVLVSGYRFRWNLISFLRILLFGGSISIICLLLLKAKELESIISIGTILVIVILFAIVLHTKTKIQFSEKYIKVSYGCLPFVRTRKTKNLQRVYIEYDESSSADGAGGGFTYLVLVFYKQWNIKVMVDPLTRRERESITGRLSYLKSKYVNDQFKV
ncbi:hypothetical protein H8K90_11075 [Winogradskyella echinorum]|uniref:YcxB-like protein n=1 Tax=Winogradskyella echinorum TaxID=538189 RepID=A0ABR6Y2G6_9FLAO|nr:hypothetical protein [Winogradskyella echinorum]MBC3846923.1 hypothetical protein [Winogradskyella echinorum]MBC5751271.1 hypothetical protein [Winogradskyella echinorum]